MKTRWPLSQDSRGNRGLPTTSCATWVRRRRVHGLIESVSNGSRSERIGPDHGICPELSGFVQSRVARRWLGPRRAENHPLSARIGFRSGLRAAYVAGHLPRFGTRRRPRRSATSFSRFRLPAKKRPSRRPLLSLSRRACQVSAVVPIRSKMAAASLMIIVIRDTEPLTGIS